jgi:hypothetical protein
LNIREYEVDALAALKNCYCLGRVSGFYDAIAALAKVIRDVKANKYLVLHD